MTANATRYRNRALLLCSLAALLTVGCASEKDHRIGLMKGRDPLLGEKIPNPNVPTGRDSYGSKETRDPLIRVDAGRTNPATPATLAAARTDAELSDLRIPDDRRANGGFASREAGANSDQFITELKRVGGKVSTPTRTETGTYEVRVRVPNGPSGSMTGYVGAGNTPVAALSDAYEQVRNERR
jgi:hypothetical protein